MSINELGMKVKELRELRRMAEELQAEIDATQDVIKTHMDSQGVDTLAGADWKVTWKPVTASRLDAAALRAALPEVAARFTRTSMTRRFTVA